MFRACRECTGCGSIVIVGLIELCCKICQSLEIEWITVLLNRAREGLSLDCLRTVMQILVTLT